jgi:hypothetical protein
MSARRTRPRLVSDVPPAPPIPSPPADFSDPESQRVLDAIATALVRGLAVQAARDYMTARPATREGA